MGPQDIDLMDWRRIIVGEVPWIFLLEVIIRIFFIYLLLVGSMRLMGKRMASTMNRNELAALVSLAAAIGIPMQQPDKGLLPAVIIALIMVTIQRSMAIWSFKNKKAEAATQGDVSVLVEDGCLMLQEMKSVGYSRERIFAQLRSEGLKNLGKVKRLYLEADGGFSMIMYNDERAGRPVIPEWDEDFASAQKMEDKLIACKSCGYVMEKAAKDHPCERCGETKRLPAIKDGG